VFALVVAHLAVAGLLPLVSARSRRASFLAAAVLPAVTLVWALLNLGPALHGGIDATTAWAPPLGLTVSFRLDALALAMIVLVSGVGAVILVYCVGYFGDSPDGTRNAALLLAFAGAMLGLVLADDLLTLYVFWELTSVASFLLVGQSGADRAARRAAVQALLVTVFGGLAMLLGFILLGEAAGTYRISEILASPPTGGTVPVALVLILLGAFTKSAQLPFHPWLPAAMAAPTPVSAYLHAASMVKAGVYLVARLSPAFAGELAWWLPIVVAGLGTMLIGGFRALRETDLKRVLAFGTVSQLGFLMVLFGAGSRVASYAGVAMLLAHGLFKAPLFMTVGTIDHSTGTRDLRELSGLWTSMRGTAVAAALAALSMAGIPPLLGFVGKEAAFEALLHDSLPAALGILVGSVLTVAYSARFLWGAFATRPGVAPTPVHAPDALLTGPTWLCALAGLVLGVANPVVDALAAPYATAYPGEDYHLALWHGLGLPLLFSAIAVVGGLLVFRAPLPERRSPLDAQRGYDGLIAGLGRVATGVTGRLQVGSLPFYLGTILVVVILLPGIATLVGGVWPADQPLFSAALQLPLGFAAAVAAVAVVRARRRFTAVLLVGVIGYAVGGLFIVDGAPDLALAQFLVETLSLVVFVFVLRRLPAHFTESEKPSRRAWVPKAVIASVGGVAVAGMAVVASAGRTAPPVASGDYFRLAPAGAGADNVVAAIIVDFRALDTVGEIGVLFIAAAGVASLVLATRYDRRGRAGQSSPEHEKDVAG
jgi:multicomponent Na+:H+ antiporter subunit A